MDQAMGRGAGQLLSRHTPDRIRTPESPDIGKDLGGIGQEVTDSMPTPFRLSFSVANTMGARMPFPVK